MLPYYLDLLQYLTDSAHLFYWNSDTCFHTHQCSAAMVALEQHHSLQIIKYYEQVIAVRAEVYLFGITV